MVYSDWTYDKRTFEDIPAGYVASTEHFSIVSGKLTENTLCGLGVVNKSQVGDVPVFTLPENANDILQFAGVLLFDQSNYRFPIQPPISHNADDIINVMRRGEVMVHTSTPVTTNGQVFLVHTTNGNELKGMFRASASANCTLIPNARWKYNYAAGKAKLSIYNVAVN